MTLSSDQPGSEKQPLNDVPESLEPTLGIVDIEETVSISSLASSDEHIFVASQWQLIRWKFVKHKLAVISLIVLVLMSLMAIFADFLVPYDGFNHNSDFVYVPPVELHFVDQEGRFHLQPFVYPLEQIIDQRTFSVTYQTNTSVMQPIYFMVHGDPYQLWGLFSSDIHLFGLENGQPGFYLFGTDRLGRDVLTRTVLGARISLSIGLVGVFLSLFLGVLMGGLSGYYGGWVDNMVQRLIVVIRSLPTIPLWMALSAAVPPKWTPEQTYFAIVVILSFIGWTGLARVVRGRFLSLREEDFVIAARLLGAGRWRIVFVHMVPSFMSYLIASLTLAIPGMILGETSLSFLGIGLRPPAVSWGVLLQEAQNVATVAKAPWLLWPGVFVVIAVLAFNFVGDGLRDAADPYSR
jgi:peptide/nickel transport system permease protein